jgi:hypothetical protein
MSNTPDLLVSDEDNDTSHVSTPVLTHLPASPSCPSFDSTSSAPIESSSSSAVHLRLPVPIPSANLSQTSFTFVDLREDQSGVDFDNLPPEVTSADISIAREFLCSTSLSITTLCLFWRHASPCYRATCLTRSGCVRVTQSKHVIVFHPCSRFLRSCRNLSHSITASLVATSVSLLGAPILMSKLYLGPSHVGALET